MYKSLSMRNCSTVSNAQQQYWSPPAQQKLISVRKYTPKTVYNPSKAPSTANVSPTASKVVPAQTAAVSNGHVLNEPMVKSAVPHCNDDNAKDLHKFHDVKHTQLFPMLMVLSAAAACVNALAEAGEFAWESLNRLFLVCVRCTKRQVASRFDAASNCFACGAASWNSLSVATAVAFLSFYCIVVKAPLTSCCLSCCACTLFSSLPPCRPPWLGWNAGCRHSSGINDGTCHDKSYCLLRHEQGG
jgi:hypothetical protein